MIVTPHTILAQAVSGGIAGYLASQKGHSAFATSRIQAIKHLIHKLHEHRALYRPFNASDKMNRTQLCLLCGYSNKI